MELFDGEFLPSYEEATSPDWLGFVASYVSPRDYARLCRVSRRFYRVFAPLLWNDPVKTARELGLDPADDVEFCRHLFLRRAKIVRASTLSLIHSLDMSDLPNGAPGLALDSIGSDGSAVLRVLPSVASKLRCILLDGDPYVDANLLAKPFAPEIVDDPAFDGPLLLSLRDCHTPLAARLFQHPYFLNLVYLDISNVPGPIKALMGQQVARPQILPRLRILKAEGLEMSVGAAKSLLAAFRTQLWSLDLSRNKLSDEILDWLPRLSFPPICWRSDVHFDVEGVVIDPLGPGTDSYGPFFFIKESQWSATFSHPQRYRTSAPVSKGFTHEVVLDRRPLHAMGAAPINNDSASSVKNILSGGRHYPILDLHDVFNTTICRPVCSGITHLHLNKNRLTARGVERLMRMSNGNLEHFECDSMLFRAGRSLLPEWLSKTEAVEGILGAAHLFRPAFSAKLQVLRIHHSLVTGVLSLEAESLTTMASIWLVETILFERAHMAYPQLFTPDMNPRLRSLTLARIPRVSTGRTIEALIGFLKLASVQERAIEDARAASPGGPPLLCGLRHIRLEFDQDPREELLAGGVSDFDAEHLVNLATDEFSFFGDSGWIPSPTSNKPSPSIGSGRQPDGAPPVTATSVSARLKHFPFTETKDEYISRPMNWRRGLIEHSFEGRIWIGSGVLGPNKAVNEYMRHLGDRIIHEGAVEPATPCHVTAGVPPDAYIISDAWEAVLTTTDVREPTRTDLAGMRDVISAIKDYRRQTRTAYLAVQEAAGTRRIPLGTPHFHWTGKLEIATKNNMDHYHDSKFWR